MKRITQETVNRAIDYDTGEIKHESKSVTYALQSEPDYIKVYLQDLLYLVGLPKHQMGVVLWLMQNCNYASDKFGQCVVLSSDLKLAMAEDIGIKLVSSINTILMKLAKKKVIEHVGRSIYRLNPYLFGRGKWQEIQTLQNISSITMRVSYNKSGKSISTVIEENKQQDAFALKSHLVELEEQAKAS